MPDDIHLMCMWACIRQQYIHCYIALRSGTRVNVVCKMLILHTCVFCLCLYVAICVVGFPPCGHAALGKFWNGAHGNSGDPSSGW